MRTHTLILTAALGAAACSNSTGPENGQPQVSLSFVALQAPGAVVASDVTIGDGVNTLTITQAEVVLRDVELWRLGIQSCESSSGSGNCEKFHTGAMLLNVPLDGSVSQEVSIAIEPGTYDRVEFDIHKVSNDDSEDAAFRAAHPDLIETSIRVRGQYNGSDFIYTSDLNESQRFNIVPPLIIDETTLSTNVTVRLDLDRWFRGATGVLIDPMTANKGETNENLVRDNIRASIEAFEDANRDGN